MSLHLVFHLDTPSLIGSEHWVEVLGITGAQLQPLPVKGTRGGTTTFIPLR